MTIGSHKVKVDKKIAEGGYADVYRVVDDGVSGSGKFSGGILGFWQSREAGAGPPEVFALKRMYFFSKTQPNVISEEDIGGSDWSFLNFDLNQIHKAAFENEVNVLKRVGDHENIVRLVDCSYIQKDSKSYEALLLLEYCPHGTLFDIIEQNCKLGLQGITCETELIKIIYDVSNGLRFLHKF